MELEIGNIIEVPEGYKQTDIGIIPEDWDLISYDRAFWFLSTATYSRADLSTNQLVKYIHYGDIHTRFEHFLNLNTELPTISEGLVKTYDFVKDGDLVMADTSEDYEGICKSVEIINADNVIAISGLHTYLFRDKNDFFADGFKAYISENSLVRDSFKRLATGMKLFGVSKTNLKTVLVPRPPINEQKAIASVLTDTDELINNLKTLIAKKKDIKLGAMQVLLTGKKRLEGFKEKWQTDKIANIMAVYRGGSPRPIQMFLTKSPTGINWIKIGDTDKFGKYIKSSREKIIPEGASNSRRVYKGNFLLSNSMSFGRPYILDIDGCVHDGWLVLQDYEANLDKEFLYYLLSSKEVHNQYLSKAAGSGVLNLNKELVNTIDLTFPQSLAEQKAISKILYDMDFEIEALSTQAQKIQDLKQGMMQELLTGKTRLKHIQKYEVEDILPMAAEADEIYTKENNTN